LEFSELGMIAKLYHTYDLESLAKIVTLFYEELSNFAGGLSPFNIL
jgi:hypothetical protein